MRNDWKDNHERLLFIKYFDFTLVTGLVNLCLDLDIVQKSKWKEF